LLVTATTTIWRLHAIINASDLSHIKDDQEESA